LGVAGLVHDHVWGELQKWLDTGRVEIVAAADANEPLRERAKNEFAIERVFDDAEQMLNECQLDVVQICTSNSAGVDVVEAAAKRSVDIVLEKPMSATLAQADRILLASQQNDSMLFVNWPNRWRTPTLQSWKLIKEGVIGHVFNARMRMAHKGPREFGCSDYFCDWLYDASQNGAGALVDYCSYGAVAFRHLFGQPSAVQAVADRLVKEDIAVDDNANITLIYDDRFAFAEASWTQIPSYHDAVFLGTTGTLWTDNGKLLIARKDGEQSEIEIEPLQVGYRTGPECYLTCRETGAEPPDVCSAIVCRDAQEILQAGIEAVAKRQQIELPLAS
jgi:predicted dehydrogenase